MKRFQNYFDIVIDLTCC